MIIETTPIDKTPVLPHTKIFTAGDEDGFTTPEGYTSHDAMENNLYGISHPMVPYVFLNGVKMRGKFGDYLVTKSRTERWLIKSTEFEKINEGDLIITI